MPTFLFKDFLKYTSPVLGNFIIWGGALTGATIIIGHFNADMVAANSIANVVRNFAVVFCAGIASGGAILVGKYLGRNQLELAKKIGARVCMYSLIFGILAGLSILLAKPFIFSVMSLTEEAKVLLNGMLFVCAYYCVGKSLNGAIIGGIFAAGGDPKFGFWCDLIVMWVIILPLSYLSAFVWQVAPLLLYVIINLDEIIKLPIAAIRYRQYAWLNNVTRETTKDGST